jgi:predicted nucleic acid-binding protein
MYLLDTNVDSELRKPKPHAGVLAWVNGVDEASLFVSAVTIGEIQAGIEVTREQDAAKADELGLWLDLLAASYNVLPIEAAAFREWSKLTHRKSNTLLEDAMIAATARLHSLTVVTRNMRDFKPLGLVVLNPFKGGAESGCRPPPCRSIGAATPGPAPDAHRRRRLRREHRLGCAHAQGQGRDRACGGQARIRQRARR